MSVRSIRRTGVVVLALTLTVGCGGPPRYAADPTEPAPPDPPEGSSDPPPPAAPSEVSLGGDVDVRVGVHWERGRVEIGSVSGMILTDGAGGADDRSLGAGEGLVVSVSGGDRLDASSEAGRPLARDAFELRVEPDGSGRLEVNGRELRGRLRLSARAGSLFVANELPLEDYLRGVVPREIGRRPEAESAAVAAQAIAARTYTVRRLDQYQSLPFDVFGDVQDQVYDGVAGEDAVADAAIRETEGLVLADGSDGLIEAYYSSTCGGERSDIRAVWPWREPHAALEGGPDGPEGQEWCRGSPHFRWTEEWTGDRLEELVHENVPAVLEMAPGSVTGRLRVVRVTKRGPSGRAALIEYRTSDGAWRVPGDRNRWVLRRPDGSILRSVKVRLEVNISGGGVARVVVEGEGNGHGVGMCQYGARGRARAGQSFRDILHAYYPGTVVRRLEGADLPAGRSGAS